MRTGLPAAVATGSEIAAAYDAVAPGYDRATVEDQWMRRILWRHHRRVFSSGDRVLDLGCGTGQDALELARRGVEVTAIDISEGMLERLRRRAETTGLRALIEVHRADLADLGTWPAGSWDGVLSSFAALNTSRDPAATMVAAAARMRRGGRMICHLLAPAGLGSEGRRRGRRPRRRRQDRKGLVGHEAVVIAGRRVRHRVLSLEEIRDALTEAGLCLRSAYALGFLWPQAWGRWLPGRLCDVLGRLEPRLGSFAPFRSRGRFYVLDLEAGDRR